MYNKAKRFVSSGEVQKAEDILQKISNYHQPPNKLLKRLETPFNLALKSVEDYIQDWLLRPTEVTPIQLRKPKPPSYSFACNYCQR
ncbi:hypothetical protein CVFO_1345 [Isorropodon fossajaponicum endosymbiont JTNG4]|nr:hypothetical protein CVFO_1345 [Isorropodon fossajaponicum endosymbiont JTNG4]